MPDERRLKSYEIKLETSVGSQEPSCSKTVLIHGEIPIFHIFSPSLSFISAQCVYVLNISFVAFHNTSRGSMIFCACDNLPVNCKFHNHPLKRNKQGTLTEYVCYFSIYL